MTSIEAGTKTEGIILAALLKAGYVVLIPFGVTRYDLAFDRAGKISTVQCKTGRLIDGAIAFKACSIDRGTQIRSGYRGQVDYFGVACPGVDDVFLVPVNEVGETEGRLRMAAPRNNQSKGIRLASDYVLR